MGHGLLENRIQSENDYTVSLLSTILHPSSIAFKYGGLVLHDIEEQIRPANDAYQSAFIQDSDSTKFIMYHCITSLANFSCSLSIVDIWAA
jgi:hypothetical protein